MAFTNLLCQDCNNIIPNLVRKVNGKIEIFGFGTALDRINRIYRSGVRVFLTTDLHGLPRIGRATSPLVAVCVIINSEGQQKLR